MGMHQGRSWGRGKNDLAIRKELIGGIDMVVRSFEIVPDPVERIFHVQTRV